MTVRWTDTAVGHLQGIHDYIGQNSPAYARRTVDRITRRSMQIGALPRSGQVVPEYGDESIREVYEKPYRIIYRVLPDQVDVLAVIHGSEATVLEPLKKARPLEQSPRTPPVADPPIRLAILASGGGSTLQNLIDRIAEGRLIASIVQVVASKPGIGAIERAERAGIPTAVVRKAGLAPEAFERAVFEPIRAAGADLVVLAGFLSLLPIPVDYLGRVVNVHPSLLPAFGGRGFHGEAVHRAAIETGVKVSGCTVHLVDEVYDNGPIILQRPVPVLDDDTPATLAARVQAAERIALPEAIALYADGRLLVEGRRVRVLDPVRE